MIFVQRVCREWSLVIAICSSREGGGNSPALALARRVLPVPGGPESRMLWRPATAIVRARLAKFWPKISSSVIYLCLSFSVFLTEKEVDLRSALPLRNSHNSRRFWAGIRSISWASRAACGRLAAGIISCLIRCCLAASIMFRMPLTGRISPFNESSPTNMRCCRSDGKSC